MLSAGQEMAVVVKNVGGNRLHRSKNNTQQKRGKDDLTRGSFYFVSLRVVFGDTCVGIRRTERAEFSSITEKVRWARVKRKMVTTIMNIRKLLLIGSLVLAGGLLVPSAQADDHRRHYEYHHHHHGYYGYGGGGYYYTEPAYLYDQPYYGGPGGVTIAFGGHGYYRHHHHHHHD